MGACRRVREALEAQMRALESDENFLNHKWYRSEEANRDIGFASTLASFSVSIHYQAFARGFRERYCRLECDFRHQCDVLPQPAQSPKPVQTTKPVQPAEPAEAD